MRAKSSSACAYREPKNRIGVGLAVHVGDSPVVADDFGVPGLAPPSARFHRGRHGRWSRRSSDTARGKRGDSWPRLYRMGRASEGRQSSPERVLQTNRVGAPPESRCLQQATSDRPIVAKDSMPSIPMVRGAGIRSASHSTMLDDQHVGQFGIVFFACARSRAARRRPSHICGAKPQFSSTALADRRLPPRRPTP